MNKQKLSKLVAEVRLSVEMGRKLEFSLRMVEFAHELSTPDTKQLREAVAAAQPPITEVT